MDRYPISFLLFYKLSILNLYSFSFVAFDDIDIRDKNLSREKLNHKNTSLRGKIKNEIKWQYQKLKHNKRMDNNCYIPDLLQAFFYLQKWLIKPGFIAKLSTCMTVASNSIILTTMFEQNKQT